MISLKSKIVPSSQLNLEISRTFEEVSINPAQWDKLAMDCNTEIYQSYDWCKTWWKHFGDNRNLHILSFKINDKLVGLLPFFVEIVGVGPARIRVAKQVGSDYTFGMMRLIVIEEHLKQIVSMTHQYFLIDEDCDCVRWGIMTENQPVVAIGNNLRPMFEEGGLENFQISHGPESILHLPDSFEAYLKSLSKNHRVNFRRSLNRLNREVDFKIRVVEGGESIGQALKSFIELHQTQWETLGESGHFGDYPKALDFHKEMANLQAKKGRFLLVCGYAGEYLVTAQYCYGIGNQLTWILPARRMEECWGKYGLGRVGFVIMVQQAIERGYRTISLGKAYWQYKSDLGGGEERSLSLIVAPSGKKGNKVNRHLLLFRLLNILLYKIWFKRVSPKLPWKRGFLWHSWFRWRL